MLDKKFFQKIGANVVARYRKLIFDNKNAGKGARDVYGNEYPPFNEYSKKYREDKKSGTLNRAKSTYKDSNAPLLTGDLFNSFQMIKVKDNGFTFGTPTQGGKVRNLRKLGRVISADDQPIPKELVEYIEDEASKYISKGWPFKRKLKININI